ncbi:MAG: biopolymer transporter Tol [Opitutaceae bacterium]
MRLIQLFLFAAVAVSFFPSAVLAQVMDGGPITGILGSGQMPVAIESTDGSTAALARRAFGIHGGFKVTASADASFVFKIQPVGSDSAEISISSGRPLQEQLKRTVRGTDRQNAVLRACDLAVEATLRTKGFFAGKLTFVGKQRGVSELYMSDLLFDNVRPLTRDRSLLTGPKWSRDGRRILYTTYYKTGFPDIYMVNLATGSKQAVATYKGANTGGVFSPSGSQIAMVLSGTGNSEIYVANSQGKSPRRLTNNRSLETSPSWSPDGRRLVFTSDAPGKPQLYEISANGGPMRRIPTNISSYCSEPVWNPVHDNLIAFTAAVRGGFQIALYDYDKRSSKILTSVTDSAVEPSWMNDGRHLVFTQRTGGKTRLMVLDSETGKVSPLHNPNFGDASSASFVY